MLTSEEVNFQWETATRLAQVMRQKPLLAVRRVHLGNEIFAGITFSPRDHQRWELLGATLKATKTKVKNELWIIHEEDVAVLPSPIPQVISRQ